MIRGNNAEVYELRTLTGRLLSARFEEAGGNAARQFHAEKRMFSRTLLLGLLLLSLTGGGS